jgi:hypothetical protein
MKDMQAKIYKPAKTAMQSGTAKTKKWIMEFEPHDTRFIEPIMGWVSSSDMRQEIKLQFETKEQAISYAKKHAIDYIVIDPKPRIMHLKSYSSNFQ